MSSGAYPGRGGLYGQVLGEGHRLHRHVLLDTPQVVGGILEWPALHL